MLLDHWLWLYCVFSECCYIIQAKTIHFWLWLYCVFHWYYLCQSGQNCIHFGCDCIVYQVSTVYIIQAKTVFILAVTVLCIKSVLFTSFRPKLYSFWLWLYCVSSQYYLHHSGQNCTHFGCDRIVYFVSTVYIIQAKTVFILAWLYCVFRQYYLHHSGQNCIHFCLQMYCLFCWYYLHHSGQNCIHFCLWMYRLFCWYCVHHSGQNCIHFCLRMYCVFCWYYLHRSGPNYPFLAVMSSFLFKAFCYKCY